MHVAQRKQVPRARVSGTPELLNLDTLRSMAADAAVSAYADADIRENFSR
jgi:hypothetical protein